MILSQDQIISESRRLTDRLKSAWKDNLKAVVLFGSRIQGNHTPESDIDILIISDNLPVRRFARRNMFREAAGKSFETFFYYASVILIPSSLAVTVRPFYIGMLDGYDILYEKDNFMTGLFIRLRERMRELGSYKRLSSSGDKYWVLTREYTPCRAVII